MMCDVAVQEGSDDSEDEEKYADQADMWGQKFDSKTRTTVRNLRIREDTAKYLFNLDLNSAFYDPKTRSMRENPFQSSTGPDAAMYPGENFVRQTGDVKKFAHAQSKAVILLYSAFSDSLSLSLSPPLSSVCMGVLRAWL